MTKTSKLLDYRYDNDSGKMEIGLDEVGRGPLFGRLYVAGVILPEDQSLFDGTNIKDSKKFSSKHKIRDVAEYIKTHALAWHIHYIEADVIDNINILQSVYRAMHECIRELLIKTGNPFDNTMVIVDGDRFKPYCVFDEASGFMKEMHNVTVEQGDSKYMSIAAASIIAKVAHDDYIEQLCKEYPQLVDRYRLDKNVGYGTKHHIDGIQQYGITQWHRRSYKICKEANMAPL